MVKKIENPVERIYYRMTPQMVRLTKRETEIVTWIAHGLRNAEISEMMGGKPSPRGIESHTRNILCKSGLQSRVQIALWAAKWKIIDLEDL